MLTQWSFHGVKEHPNRSSNEKVMTFRSWRSHMTKQSYPNSLPYLPGRPFSAGSDIHCPPKGLAGKFTQWPFYGVQEHLNRNSDEKVMTFRSWRSHRILVRRNPSEESIRGEPSRGDPAGRTQPNSPSTRLFRVNGP